jgi:hypothetical protein
MQALRESQVQRGQEAVREPEDTIRVRSDAFQKVETTLAERDRELVRGRQG